MRSELKRLCLALAGTFWVVGCGSTGHGAADAAVDAQVVDAAPDRALDAAPPVDMAPPPDAAPDGPPDAAPDAAMLTDGPPPDGPPTAYSQVEIGQLFTERCAGCHTGGAHLGDLSLDGDWLAATSGVAAPEVAAVHLIEPGDHTLSYLWRKLAGTHTEADIGGTGTQMPQARPPLSDLELERIALFIDALPPIIPEDCANGLDDDGNGQTDCDDAACAPTLACQPEDCTDAVDNNNDGLADCADPLCAAFPPCVPEDCANGIDDNANGLADCNDDACYGVAACMVGYSHDEVQQLFNTYCVGCHVGGASLGGLPLDPPFELYTINHASVRGEMDRIEPGSRERSFLFRKVEGTHDNVGGGDRMPKDAAPLNRLQLERLGLYIEGLPVLVEDCGNHADDDGDHLIDCNDSDCFGEPACQAHEICDNGADDDGDFLTDCNDPDCAGLAGCGISENCADNRDNDGDLLIDCADGNCIGNLACAVAEICDNGADDDGDGAVDCADADCRLSGLCAHGEQCANGADDDADGLVDCADADCALNPVCQFETCSNGVDDNADGLADCADPQCAGTPICSDEICGNGLDDNANGLTDCADLACAALPACATENCLDHVDNDGNGLVDCDDPSCAASGFCNVEICNDGIDNNANRFIDCFDPDCALDPSCIAPYATADVQSIFVQSCGCHSGGAPAGQMSLEAPFEATTVNVPSSEGAAFDRIEPGNHLASQLWLKLAGQQQPAEGVRMPRGGPYLSDTDMARLAAWIDALPQ